MRNHLFNFVTLRNPQTVSEADRSRFHVLLSPDARETTHYFRDLSSDEFRELKFEIGRRSANFQNGLSLQELKAAHADSGRNYPRAGPVESLPLGGLQ